VLLDRTVRTPHYPDTSELSGRRGRLPVRLSTGTSNNSQSYKNVFTGDTKTKKPSDERARKAEKMHNKNAKNNPEYYSISLTCDKYSIPMLPKLSAAIGLA